MSYVFTKTERNNLKASVFETKSLLYLAAQNSKYKNVSYLTIDCFNDVSGVSVQENIWDVQAKNEQALTPRKIGNYLITLYENYTSIFQPFFQEFIFFMPKIKPDYVVDFKLPTYTLDNFKDLHKSRVIEGLKSKAGLDSTVDLSHFLSKLIFVEDRSEEQFYVKGIMHFKSSKLCNEGFYKTIFKEIMDRQLALKNSEIENEVIKKPLDVLRFRRSFTTEDLQVFVLNRFVGSDVFASRNNCPTSYLMYTRRIDEDDMEDHVYEQNAALSRAFFDKNNQKNFWHLFEVIFRAFHQDSRKKVSDIVKVLKPEVIEKVQHMDISSTRFLIAMIRDGLKDDN